MPKPYQWLLFDADDTLFDYQKAEGLALARAFERASAPFGPDLLATYRHINHGLWLGVERGEITPDAVRVRRYELFFEEIKSPLPPEDFSLIYQECLADSSELLDGAYDLLAALHRRYHCAIITNGLRDVQTRRLAKSPIQPFIEALFISEEVGASKPARAFFDVTFERLGNPSKETALVIGDSLTSDMAGGAGYGIDTCWYNPSGKPNTSTIKLTYEIAHLDDLLVLLG